MPNPSYLLGLDISTTAAKALLIDTDGHVVASVSSPLTLSTPHPLWSEQDPADWWYAMVSSIRQLLATNDIPGESIEAIGLTGQMHGLVVLGEHGDVLRPAILWNDQRTAAQCDEIRRLVGRQRLIEICGNDALTGFTAPKILWVRDHEPDVYTKIRHVLLPKDFIRWQLTGEHALDRAGGSGTILFDLAARNWSEELLQTLHIPGAWMPPTFEGPAITGLVTAEAAKETGLAAGTPVVGGGGDQAAQATGVGAVRPGVVALTLGTSGVVFASTDRPLVEPDGRLHAFCHAVPDRWHFMGVMLSAAGSLQWYRDNFAPELDFADLISEAATVDPGSDGLLFLPYLTGERTPHPDPLARGAWVGLTNRHSRAHMTRAVLEGVAFGLRDSFTLISDAGLKGIEQVRISGGGARSELWRQILADLLGVELVTVNTSEGAAFGAALLAGVGHGIWPTVDVACEAVVVTTSFTRPNPEPEATYSRAYELYRDVYPALRPTMHKLHEMG